MYNYVLLQRVDVSASPSKISANCMFCRLSNSAENKEMVASEVCPMCNLSDAESQHFTKAMINVRYINI